jgi:hypothetical protein
MNGFTPPPNLQPQNFEEFRRRMAGMNTAGSAIAQGADSLRAFMQNRARLDQGRYDSLLAAALKLKQMQALEAAKARTRQVAGPKPEKLGATIPWSDWQKMGMQQSGNNPVFKMAGMTTPWVNATDREKAEAWISTQLPSANARMAVAKTSSKVFDPTPLAMDLEEVSQLVGQDYWKKLGTVDPDKAKLAQSLMSHFDYAAGKGIDLGNLGKGLRGIIDGSTEYTANKHASEIRRAAEGDANKRPYDVSQYGGRAAGGKFVPFTPDYLKQARAEAADRVRAFAKEQTKAYNWYPTDKTWNDSLNAQLKYYGNEWVPEELKGDVSAMGMDPGASTGTRAGRSQSLPR